MKYFYFNPIFKFPRQLPFRLYVGISYSRIQHTYQVCIHILSVPLAMADKSCHCKMCIADLSFAPEEPVSLWQGLKWNSSVMRLQLKLTCVHVKVSFTRNQHYQWVEQNMSQQTLAIKSNHSYGFSVMSQIEHSLHCNILLWLWLKQQDPGQAQENVVAPP